MLNKQTLQRLLNSSKKQMKTQSAEKEKYLNSSQMS